MDAVPIPVYHTRGPSACGSPALGVKVRHPFTDARSFPADNVVCLDGTAPIRGTIPVCGSCGRVIDSFAELTYRADGRDPGASLVRSFIRRVLHA